MVICQVPAEQVVNATGIRKDHAYLARLHLDLYKELVPDQHKSTYLASSWCACADQR